MNYHQCCLHFRSLRCVVQPKESPEKRVVKHKNDCGLFASRSIHWFQVPRGIDEAANATVRLDRLLWFYDAEILCWTICRINVVYMRCQLSVFGFSRSWIDSSAKRIEWISEPPNICSLSMTYKQTETEERSLKYRYFMRWSSQIHFVL